MALRDLRIVFMGMSHIFARTVLRAVARRCNVIGIVEALPKEETEGNSSLSGFAKHRRIPYLPLKRQDLHLKEFLERLAPDVACVSSFTHILKPEEFRIPRLGTINLHPSALPKYRGPNPQFWQAHEMDLDGATTIHFVDDGIDTGDILVQEHFSIRLGSTFMEIFNQSLKVGTGCMIRALELLAAGRTIPRPQREMACPLYARLIGPSEQLIQWEQWPIERLWHFLRATHEKWPCLPLPDECKGRWMIGPMERGLCKKPAGNIGQDHSGHYVAHSEGKIRLKLIAPPSRVEGFLLNKARELKHRIEWW